MTFADRVTQHIINHIFADDSTETLEAILDILHDMPDPDSRISGIAVDLEHYYRFQQGPAQGDSLISSLYQLAMNEADWLKISGKLIDHFKSQARV